MKAVIALTSLLLFITPCWSDEWTPRKQHLSPDGGIASVGLDLYEQCKDDDPADGYTQLLCAQTIMVLSEAIGGQRDANGNRLFCKPEPLSYGQVKKAFLKYADDHPDKLGVNMPIMFTLAMRSAYPCAN